MPTYIPFPTIIEAAALVAHASLLDGLRNYSSDADDPDIDANERSNRRLAAAAIRACETGVPDEDRSWR